MPSFLTSPERPLLQIAFNLTNRGVKENYVCIQQLFIFKISAQKKKTREPRNCQFLYQPILVVHLKF